MGASPLSGLSRKGSRNGSHSPRLAHPNAGVQKPWCMLLAMIVTHTRAPADRSDQRAGLTASRGAGECARTALASCAVVGRPWPLRFESVRDLCFRAPDVWPKRPVSPHRQPADSAARRKYTLSKAALQPQRPNFTQIHLRITPLGGTTVEFRSTRTETARCDTKPPTRGAHENAHGLGPGIRSSGC